MKRSPICNVKTNGRCFQIFVAFSENLNFTTSNFRHLMYFDGNVLWRSYVILSNCPTILSDFFALLQKPNSNLASNLDPFLHQTK